MKAASPLLILALASASAKADLVTATFEDRYPGADSTALDFRASGDRFTSGGFTFSNHYTPPAGIFGAFYSGFGVSSRVDNVPANDPLGSSDYDHAYGAYAPVPPGGAGTGSGGSATYAVAFNYFAGDATIDLPAGYAASSIDVANTTYAASTILFGDGFSRPFGRDGDFFRLDILGFAGPGASGAQVGDVPVVLASFQGGALTLLSGFATVDLTSLAGARSLAFSLDTNVTNSLGPSLPFTFAADNIVAVRPVPEPSGLVLIAIGALGLAASRRRSARA